MASASGHNKEFFDKEASSYDSKHGKTLDQILQEIRARLHFLGVDWVDDDGDDGDDKDKTEGKEEVKNVLVQKKTVRLLDYACGTGVVSRALAPYVSQCVGIDLSEGMVAAYNARTENQGIPFSEMRAHQGNLCVPSDPNPPAFASAEFFDFDVAAVGLGFHHFDDPVLAARRLAARLKTGGVLVILDFLPHGELDPSHASSSTVTHHGFSVEQIQRIYEEAGVGKDFALETVGVVFFQGMADRSEMKRKIFIARGTKA
ncbi:putative methyltransferase YcgJ [Madurella mycetomatis]|uniref:Methyltransferase YcgJ n=1 Tax=Madurella mycetomatis TaxID=100816 RepID=A0A175W104_9PEZI|nr:putative methyltransferase YcgJ [Madurella mycetomatis]